ncbi:MAG: exonuclease domain-containing protein [Bacteroidota bacterium]
MYAILDIETTGGSPKTEKITEIAIFFHDGTRITGEWASLINPERNIPYFITGLTGITNEMVADAPRFYEIAGELVKMTEGCTIVGHNVSFDYAFIKSEFKQLGYDYDRPTLCTVRMGRKILPGHKSYSLGKICNDLGIEINDRHRAAGDALATVRLFEYLREQTGEAGFSALGKTGGRIKNLNAHLTVRDIDSLPEKTGTYYFYNEHGQLIYIGKSKNIRQRVLTHLGNTSTRKALEMKERISSISYELTGSELIALLKESDEIKRNRPLYNRSQRQTVFSWGLYSGKDEYGYITLEIAHTAEKNSAPVTCFNNKTEARESLTRLVEKYWLCQKLSGLYETDGACFHHSIRQCNGACIQQEAVKTYNARVEQMLDTFRFAEGKMLIIDEGREAVERSVIRIENGVYIGYGFIRTDESYLTLEQIIDAVRPAMDNRDVRQILRNWLKNNKVEKILRY